MLDNKIQYVAFLVNLKQTESDGLGVSVQKGNITDENLVEVSLKNPNCFLH